MRCPCGNPAELEECCGRFIAGEAQPETAEELMRSRYSAYVVGALDYIVDTHDPRTRDIDRADVERWSKGSQWLGLKIVSIQAGGPDDQDGIVEFQARFFDTTTRTHHERSAFRRDAGRWVYVSGTPPESSNEPRRVERIGRNEPCSCGSGRKFKKCCGQPGA